VSSCREIAATDAEPTTGGAVALVGTAGWVCVDTSAAATIAVPKARRTSRG
jgi:hypothetical protein